NETTHGKKMAVKPLRPRMPSRPRVVKGSLAEATWARNCLNVMRGYLVALKEYDHTLKLSSSDVAKVVVWCEIIGEPFDEDFWKK
ncbi:TPA: replication initiation protein, partial [Escherichia coli]|nr:replication initiation protein [Escherichia coli]